jgi:ATP adenylyltransferase
MNYLRTIISQRKEGCLFCDMLRAHDDTKNHILHRGDSVFVTLNLYPYSNGHLMVVPNHHVPTLEDLDEATLAELLTVTQRCLALLRAAYNPDGFNVGINIGSAAGAGLADHVHQHIVPRWAGDTNFMTTLAETRVIPEWVDETYAELRALWLERFSD